MDNIRVLLADFSPDTALLLKTLLEETGDLSVETVNDGERALASISENPPDVFVTELLLPRLDGMSLLRRLKDEGRLPRTVILSAFWNDRLAYAARLLGVEHCLAKPCRAEILIRYLHSLAGGAAGCPMPDPTVRQALSAFGIPSHLSGYGYLAEGISRILQDRSCLQGITKSLYRDIARSSGASAPAVERAMRNAIGRGWERLTPAERRRRFGSLFDGCDRAPSNLLFLGAMAEHLEFFACGNVMER